MCKIFGDAKAHLFISILDSTGRLNKGASAVYVSNSRKYRKNIQIRSKRGVGRKFRTGWFRTGWPKTVLCYGSIDFDQIVKELQENVFPEDKECFLIGLQMESSGSRRYWINPHALTVLEDLQDLRELGQHDNGGPSATRFFGDLKKLLEIDIAFCGIQQPKEDLHEILKRELESFRTGFSIWH